MLTFVSIFLAIVVGQASPAGSNVALEIESRTLIEGEPTDLTLTCTNTGEPGPIQLNAPEGLELVLVNKIPARSSMVSIVNGARSERTTYTFSLRLTGKKAGTYTLPPIVVPIGDTQYETEPITITVTRPADEAVKDGDRIVFVRITATPTSIYVTQSIEATLTLGIRKFERDGQAIELGNLLNLVDANGSELSVFGNRFNSNEVTLTDSKGQAHEYVIYRQSKEIRAEQVGMMNVGPVFFRVNYPVSLKRSIFGGYDVAQRRREVARAPAIPIEVKGPPADGRPPTFTGAIGQYQMSVSAKPTRVEQGQPVTLTMSITGGPLEGITGPDLKQQAELTARFDFTAEDLPGEKEGKARVFRRAIFPRRDGEQTIPPISWSFFDPATEKYVTRSSPPIPITVDPATTLEGGTGAGTPQAASTLTRTTGGISPIVVDPKLVLSQHEHHVRPAVLGATLAVPPAIWLATMFVAWRGARMRTDANWARRRGAAGRARKRLRNADREGDSGKRMRVVDEALSGFICERFDLPLGEVTPADARQIVALRTKETGLAEEVAKLLESCDMAMFAGASARTADAAIAARRAADLITRMERAAS